jgi:hypothetical protein
LIERFVRNEEVVGLIPICSTIFRRALRTQRPVEIKTGPHDAKKTYAEPSSA